MKKYYYLSNANQRFGPYTKEELKSENISKNTLIWFEGMDDWKQADLISEIKDLFIISTPPPPPPPPVTNKLPPVYENVETKTSKKKSGVGIYFLIGLVVILGVIGILAYNKQKNNSSSFSSYNSNSGSSYTAPQTYEQKVMSVEETEQSQPTTFLTTSGTYLANIWGDKFNISGTITSSATVAKFKDVVIEVIYYSSTNTELNRKRFTVFQYIRPGQTIRFEKKIDKPGKSYKKLNWFVVSATPE